MVHAKLEEEWVDALRNGLPEAFEQCYTKYDGFVLQLAFQWTKDVQEAEEIKQDVFMEVYRKIDSFDPKRASFKAWLSMITRCRAIDCLRKRKTVHMLGIENELEISDPSPLPEEIALMKWQCEKIIKALQQIPEEQRLAVWANYYMDFTHKEIARKLNRPLGSVKSLIRYGIQKIKKQIETQSQVNV